MIARFTSTFETVARGVAAAVCVLPALAIAGEPVRASLLQCAVAGAIALAAILVASAAPRVRLLAGLGVLGCGTAAWLLAQVSYPVASWLIGPALGLGAGLAAPSATIRRRSAASALAAGLAAFAGAGALVALRAELGRDAALAAGAGAIAVVGAWSIIAFEATNRTGWRALFAVGAVAVVLPLASAAYVGATTPRVTWFGDLTSHGPRSGNEVALTFDDGPNGDYTREVARILDAHGAKGTFFTVGKALDRQPEVSRFLLEDGQLLGNHSYSHDAVSWLDPRYLELQKTQDTFKKKLGVCPAFYRPPHGSHTPFMSHVVADHGMTMVTWDASAGDWATTDAHLVARRILDGVRPGSIILLHDGLDGHLGADRTVAVRALPLILDGLRARGLQPVTLDKLLGKPAYVPC